MQPGAPICLQQDCEAGFPLALIIPVYGAPNLLRRCLRSMAEGCLPPDCELWIADDCTSDGSIADVAQEFQTHLPGLRYVRRERRLGFVGNCNLSVETVLPSGRDVLLLSPDAKLRPGALSEMLAVLHSHERHAVVSPRSNDAGIFSITPGERYARSVGYTLWNDIRAHLPRFQVMPTSDGSCMLVRNAVLRMFGLFDPIYVTGPNAERDFVCRINRCGYSAVAANHAFVFYHRETSCDRQDHATLRDRAVLDWRYPEFGRALAQHRRHYVQPVEHLSAAFRNRRQRILFDLSHLSARHCGSSEFATSLLLHLAPLLEEKYDLNLLLTSEGASFFGPELTGYRVLDADSVNDAAVFDLVYRPAQVFLWPEWCNMVRRGARLAYTHLDVIATRCDYLCGPNTRDLFRTVAESVDLGFTISEFSKHDFEALYGVHSRFEVIHLGAPETPPARHGGEYVLVVGNGYPHKAVDRAVDALRGVGPIVALGGDSAAGVCDPGVLWKSSGLLTRRGLTDLYQAASVVVCPSVYEGFGLPVLEALAHAKPVVALDLEVNRELAGVVQSPDFHLVPDFSGIRRVVQSLIESGPVPSGPLRLRSWKDTAREYADAFEGLLDAGINIDLVNRRWKLIRTLEAYHP